MKITLSEKKQNHITFFSVVIGLFTIIIVDSKFWGTNPIVKWFGIAIAIFGLSAYFLIRNKKYSNNIVRMELSWSVLIFIISLFASWIISVDPRQGISRVSWILTYILFFHIMLDLFDNGINKKIVFNAVLFVSGIVLLLALMETYANYYMWWQNVGSMLVFPPYPYRFISIIGHSNSMMGFVNVLAPLTVLSLVKAEGIKGKFPYAIWLFCYLVAIPFSSSRGGWIGVISWLVALTFYMIWRKKPLEWWNRLDLKKRVVFILVLMFCLIIGLVFGYRLFVNFASHPSHGANIFGGRGEIWSNALRVWQDNFWFGAGPGRVGFATLAVTNSIPPGFWPLHAHSVPVQVLAEFGLLGMISLLLFMYELSRWIYRRFQLMNEKQYEQGMMILFGLFAWMIQMLVDDQTAVVSVVFTVLILLAMLITLPDAHISRWQQIKNMILVIPCSLVILGSIGVMSAYQPFVYAVDYFEHGNYEKGVPLLTKTINRDSNYTFYKTQAAYLYAIAGSDMSNEAYFIEAHNQFESSLNIEPDVSVFYANLAMINWQTHYFHEKSISNIQKAIDLSPKEASYYLNLGWFYEKSEKDIQAVMAYEKALEIKPEWLSHPFWNLSDVRNEALTKWLDNNQLEEDQNNSYWERADELISLGSFEEADQLLNDATWVGESEIAINITRGKLAAAQGNTEQWVQLYENVSKASISERFDSPHRFMLSYSIWMNNRSGYIDDFVPGYLSLSENVGQFDAMEELSAYYISNKDCENATRVWTNYQKAMHGNALEPYSDIPGCTD